MAAQGTTGNYGFPLYEPDNTTSYLVSWNQAMSKIDETCKTIADAGGDTGQALSTLQATVEQVSGQVEDLQTAVGNVNTTLSRTISFSSKPIVRTGLSTSGGGSVKIIVNENGRIGSIMQTTIAGSTPFVCTLTGIGNSYVLFKTQGNVFGVTPCIVTTRDSNNIPTVIDSSWYWIDTMITSNQTTVNAYLYYDTVSNQTYFTQTGQFNQGQVYKWGGVWLYTGSQIPA